MEKLFREPLKLKIAASFKYILIFASIVMLCFPVQNQSRRFIETVRMAPVLDQLLRQLSGHEFIVYNQDAAAVLFYSQELKRVKNISDQASLEEALAIPDNRPRFCYLSEQDFVKLAPPVRQNCQVILKYKDKLIISSQKDPAYFVTLP